MKNAAINRYPMIIDVQRRFQDAEYISLFNIPIHAVLNKFTGMKIREARIFGIPNAGHSSGYLISTVSLRFLKNLMTNPDFELVSMEITLDNGIEIDSDGASEMFIRVKDDVPSASSVYHLIVNELSSEFGIKINPNCCYVFDGSTWKTHASLRCYLDEDHRKKQVRLNGRETFENRDRTNDLFPLNAERTQFA